jgi:hypothetical protein
MNKVVYITLGLIVYLGLMVLIGRFCGLSSVGDEIFESKEKKDKE